MAKEIEINPMITAAPFLTFQDFSVKNAAFIQIMDRDGKVKGGNVLHDGFFLKIRTSFLSLQKRDDLIVHIFLVHGMPQSLGSDQLAPVPLFVDLN